VEETEGVKITITDHVKVYEIYRLINAKQIVLRRPKARPSIPYDKVC
jgi:hypothetical protein